MDLNKTLGASKLNFYSDTSVNEKLEFGVIFNNSWTFGQREPYFKKKEKPSIGYLELYCTVFRHSHLGKEDHCIS